MRTLSLNFFFILKYYYFFAIGMKSLLVKKFFMKCFFINIRSFNLSHIIKTRS